MTLLAYHSDKKIKQKYLDRVQAHRIADSIVKGNYWEGGKGCAVGCTIHSSDHRLYETELGIPEWLARVEDVIFEGLPNKKAKFWPEQFLSAIRPGRNLERIKTPFIVVVLENSIRSMESAIFDKAKNPEVVKAIELSTVAVKEMIHCHKEGVDRSAACAARSAESAARSATYEYFADELLKLIEGLK